MNDLGILLEQIDDQLARAVQAALREAALAGADDDELLTLVSRAAGVARRIDALLIDGTAQIADRSTSAVREERLSTRMGCRSVIELLQRATRASHQSAAEWERAARGIHQEIAPSSGATLPAEFPALRDALADGAIGRDGICAVMRSLSDIAGTAGRHAQLAADQELARAARGIGADGAPPACADDLRLLAQVWAVYLDPDGAEPREARAMRRRGLTLGQARDGLVAIRGHLLPEVAAQMQTLFDSILNPKLDGPRFVADDDAPFEARADTRTRPQKQHDALAAVLTVAAGSGELPAIGGAAPTLVVAVRAEDYASGRGVAHAQGCDEPVSLSVARHVACCGDVQRVVFDTGGRITSLTTTDRVFNRSQRRAIALRDGGCVIPGCHVPARWCEIHHVAEAARGGPTHTDNGVPLCWWHHRSLDTSGWGIRMNRGVPEVRGPGWWDVERRWRPVTKSPVRMVSGLAGGG